MLKKIFIWLFIPLLLIQLIKIDISTPRQKDALLEIKAPQKVMNILKKSCYDCHSYESNIPWYGDIAPFSWEVKGHIKDARRWLNFQEWEDYTKDKKDKIYKGIYKTVGKTMPLPMYVTFHEDAKITIDEKKIIKKWLEEKIKN